MEIRKIRRSDEQVFRLLEQALLEDKATNPFVEWWQVEDFGKFVAQSDQSEIKQVDQTWSPFTRYFAIVDGQLAGFVICFWEMDHPDCLKLGHLGFMVSPSWRRQGIASCLLRFALNQYRERQVEEVLIATDQTNLPCRSLIESFGGTLVALEAVPYLGKELESARYRLKTEVV